MRVRAQLTRRWLGPLVVAAICLGGLGGGFGRSSASPTAARIGVFDASPQARPHPLRVPSPKSLFRGIIGVTTSARDGKAKINLSLPAVTAAAYLDPQYRTPKSQTVPVASYDLPRHPKAGCQYNAAVLNADLYAVHIKQPNKKKPGVITSVGHFPVTHVSALAFGSIPVTATLHTRQIKRNGKLVPLTADTITAYTATAKSDGSDCDPNWDSGTASPPLGTVSHGSLAVRITDVRVDKQRIDVGRHCHTVTPLELNLFGRPGYILYTGGVLIQRRAPKMVHADGNVYPLHPGSSNLDLPPFADCVNPATGEDYSRLLTGTVSGPTSTLAVHQSTAVLNNFHYKHPSLCKKNGRGCVKTPTSVAPPRPGQKVRLHR